MAHLRPVAPPGRIPLSDSELDAVIQITNLRLRTFVGFNDDEQEKQQDVIINCEIHYSASSACITDNENQALDYKLITKAIIDLVENGRFRLLEKLTAEILTLILDTPGVSRAQVTVDKPFALRFADSVSITLSGKGRILRS